MNDNALHSVDLAPDTLPTWPDQDIPQGWRRDDRDPERVIVLSVTGKDRGSSWTEHRRVARADFINSGKTRKARFEWLEGVQRETVKAAMGKVARIAKQEPMTLDRLQAGIVLHEIDQYWPGGVSPHLRPLLYERVSLLLAQTRGELNLRYPDKPIEDLNPYAQEEAPQAQAAPEGVLT